MKANYKVYRYTVEERALVKGEHGIIADSMYSIAAPKRNKDVFIGLVYRVNKVWKAQSLVGETYPTSRDAVYALLKKNRITPLK